MLAIETRDLVKRYGRFKALDGLDLEVEEGTVYGFLGPNGAGKTTTIKIIMGLLSFDTGSASISGRDVTDGDPSSRVDVGYMPELPSFPTHLTGRELLDIYGQLYGMSKEVRISRAEELLELIGLEGLDDRRIDGYSKGMQQRLGVAQSLISDPGVVILDEPTAGLDPEGRAEVREIIREIGEEGVTVFLSSHLLEEVEKICSHVSIINKGKTVMTGSLEEVSKRFSEGMEIVVEVAGIEKGLIESLERIDEVVRVDREGKELTIYTRPSEGVRERISRAIVEEGGIILAMMRKTRSLEDVFLEVTKEEGSEDE